VNNLTDAGSGTLDWACAVRFRSVGSHVSGTKGRGSSRGRRRVVPSDAAVLRINNTNNDRRRGSICVPGSGGRSSYVAGDRGAVTDGRAPGTGDRRDRTPRGEAMTYCDEVATDQRLDRPAADAAQTCTPGETIAHVA